MSEAARRDDLPEGVRSYLVLCLVALLAMALPLAARRIGVWSLFPTLVGAVAVAARWRAGPVLVLLALLWLATADGIGHSPLGTIEFLVGFVVAGIEGEPFLPPVADFPRRRLQHAALLPDFFLAAAVVAYVAGHYRLVSLTRNVFPVDRRRKTRPRGDGRPALLSGPVHEQRRSPATVEPQEGGGLLLAAVLCASVGQIFWLWLSRRDATTDLNALLQLGATIRLGNGLWRLLVLVWVVGLLLAVAAGVLGYLGQRRLSPGEAGLYLQDELWRQTRREQARLNRWLAWAVLRRRRRLVTRARRGRPPR